MKPILKHLRKTIIPKGMTMTAGGSGDHFQTGRGASLQFFNYYRYLTDGHYVRTSIVWYRNLLSGAK